MTQMRIDFYQEVEIVRNAKNSAYAGQKGVVMGVSEEDGVLYGYAVAINGKDAVVSFDKEDVVPTGVKFKREDFYDGSHVTVSVDGVSRGSIIKRGSPDM
ncbi:hypothetical protein AGMMS49545_24160 [Betaproteobacteria bacterium]|nr:hypothetical protein AGMMS49545_24160 [Betaproteobacteria bacterium]